MDFTHARNGAQSGSESESEMEWEEVLEAQPAASTSQAEIGAEDGAGRGIEVMLKPGTMVTMSSKRKGNGKGRPSGFSAQAALQRAYRQDVHKIHAASLLISGHIRNGWLNETVLQARLMSKVPLSVQNKFHEYSKTTHPKATDRSRLFESAMKGLVTWWSERFRIEECLTKAGLGGKTLFSSLECPCSIAAIEYSDLQGFLGDLSPRDRTRLLMPFADDAQLQELVEAFPSPEKSTKKVKSTKLPKPLSSELGELIRNSQSLAKRALKMSGTRDISAQLFTSLCRALDIPARLVYALPSVDYRSNHKMQKDEKIIDIRTGGSGRKRKRETSILNSEDAEEEEEEEEDFEEVQIPASMPSNALRKTAARNGNVSDSSFTTLHPSGQASRRGKGPVKPLFANRKDKFRAESIDVEDPITAFPTFWTEVYNRSLQEWITIDPVRNKVRCKKGEMDNGRLFYVVAYEVDQYVKDVTPRYARSFAGRTLKMRIQSRRKDDPDWWEELIRPWSRPFLLGREKKEDDELMKQQETEPMPTIIEGFKNHPRYALERHLKREEALPARTRQLGLFRGEPVYPRSAVIPVKSSETWMREGRKIREGEQALKMVKQRAVTINKRRAQEMAQQEGLEPVMQGLYSASQTELVIPPPIIDGKIPKNSYGNLDLFAPHMLPRGAVHLPFKTVRKVAKELGVEFAEAITGFEFHKRRAVPIVSGIVIAAEHEEMVLEAYYASETAAIEKELIKRKERCLKRWKKLIIGLRVRSRIQGEYKKDKSKTEKGAVTNKDKTEGTSQLQPLKEDAKRPQSVELEYDNNSPRDPLTGSEGIVQSDSIHPFIPEGAAFPPLSPSYQNPTLDVSQTELQNLSLPPMPAPDPTAMFTEINMDSLVNQPYTLNASTDRIDMGDFALSKPEAMAQSDQHIAKMDSTAAGGFLIEDEAKSVASSRLDKEDDVIDALQEGSTESNESEVDLTDIEEEESDLGEQTDQTATVSTSSTTSSHSPPPAKRTRAAQSAARPKAHTRGASATARKEIVTDAENNTRRTTRSSNKLGSVAHVTRSTRGAKVPGKDQVKRESSRPQRAAAARGRIAAIADQESSATEDSENE